MEYEVREYQDGNMIYTKTYYGIFHTRAKNTAHTTDPLNGLIFSFVNKEYADLVCLFMNADYEEEYNEI